LTCVVTRTLVVVIRPVNRSEPGTSIDEIMIDKVSGRAISGAVAGNR
jgi:hypothetical protein